MWLAESKDATIHKTLPRIKRNTTTPSRNIKEVNGVLAHPDDLPVTNLFKVVTKMTHWQKAAPILNNCYKNFQTEDACTYPKINNPFVPASGS